MKRWWIFGAIALLAIIAAFWILRKPTGGRDAASPDLMRHVPAHATSVVYIDVEKFRASQFIARMQSLLPDVKEDPEYKRFVTATNFDYSRDLSQVVVAFANTKDSPHTLAFAKGNFNREKLMKHAVSNGRVKHIDGVEVLFASREPQSPGFVVLSDDRVAVAEAAPNNAEYLAALAKSRTHPGPSTDLRERIARVSAAPFFAAGRAEDVTRHLPPRGTSTASAPLDQAREILKNVRWYGLAAQPEGNSLRVLLEAECDNVLRAGQLSVLLDSARLIARAALQDPKTRRQYPPAQIAMLEELLHSAQISRDQHRVRLSLVVSAELFGK